jgi:hypothetical protein
MIWLIYRKLRRSGIAVALFLLNSTVLLSQSNDFGIWTSIGAEKKVGKFNFGAETELRNKDHSEHIDRWSMGLDANYTIIKPVAVGLGYEFIYYHDTKYSDYQIRNRPYAYLTAKQKLWNLTFSLRERIQLTTKDESDRIKKSGKIDTYAINPDVTWRNRIKIAYNISHFPVNPSFSLETFYQLNNPAGNDFEDLRYCLTLSYTLNKHHEWDLFSLIDKEINVNDPVQLFVAGLSYTYTF